MLNYMTFLYFFIHLLIYFLILFYLHYYIIELIKFVIIKTSINDIWTYFDDCYRQCTNETFYDNYMDIYILDYEYFEIIDMIYYHNNFLDPDMEWYFYFEFMHEMRTREDDEHELYGLMSTYIVPLQYKYYLLEHYWPSDEYGYYLKKNFYDFNDLMYEFKFFQEEYFDLWFDYEEDIHSRTLFYDYELYEDNILQVYIYDKNTNAFLKQPLSELIINEKKNIFWKKESREFTLEKPSEELSVKKYMTWWYLQRDYDLAKFEYKVFCNLSPYEFFDKKFYDFFICNNYNLIDLRTKYCQYVETKDEYFNDYINRSHDLTYYFKLGFIYKYKHEILFQADTDPLNVPFHYLHFNFRDRGLLMFIYLLLLSKFLFIFFLFLVCYFCFSYYYYAFDFNLHLNYIRLLSRTKMLNDYINYKDLIFNLYYTQNDAINILYEKDSYREFLRIYKCTRDQLFFKKREKLFVIFKWF